MGGQRHLAWPGRHHDAGAAELNVLPDVIALVAVIGGYPGVTSSNWNNVRLTREACRRDRLTETDPTTADEALWLHG